MNNEMISPLYLMDLAERIEARLWEIPKVSKYRFVENYIDRFHVVTDEFDFSGYSENFHIYYKDENETNIDLNKTLNKMPGEWLLKIANDLGVETPGFIPVVAKDFKVILEQNNKNAKMAFDKAIEDAYANPADSVMEAATALDSLLKAILRDKSFSIETKKNDGLSKRISCVLSALGLDKKSGAPGEIFRITSSIDNIIKEIDNIRSDKTFTHGKLPDDFIVDDPLWAVLSINMVASIGLFLWNYYEVRFKDANVDDNAMSAKLDIGDIPF